MIWSGWGLKSENDAADLSEIAAFLCWQQSSDVIMMSVNNNSQLSHNMFLNFI